MAVPAASRASSDGAELAEPEAPHVYRWLHAQDGAVQFVMELQAAGGPPPEYITRRAAYDADSREIIADDEFPPGTSWESVCNEVDLVRIPGGPRDVKVLYEFKVPDGKSHPVIADHPEAAEWFADLWALEEGVPRPSDDAPEEGPTEEQGDDLNTPASRGAEGAMQDASRGKSRNARRGGPSGGTQFRPGRRRKRRWG